MELVKWRDLNIKDMDKNQLLEVINEMYNYYESRLKSLREGIRFLE